MKPGVATARGRGCTTIVASARHLEITKVSPVTQSNLLFEAPIGVDVKSTLR